MVFMEVSTSVGNNLKMHLSGINESPTTIVEDESLKSSLCNDSEKPEEVEVQVEQHLVANEGTIKISVKNDKCVDKLGKNGRNLKK